MPKTAKLETPFTAGVQSFTGCPDHQPPPIPGAPGSDSSLPQVTYTKPYSISPAALETPFGTAVTGIGKKGGQA